MTKFVAKNRFGVLVLIDVKNGHIGAGTVVLRDLVAAATLTACPA